MIDILMWTGLVIGHFFSGALAFRIMAWLETKNPPPKQLLVIFVLWGYFILVIVIIIVFVLLAGKVVKFFGDVLKQIAGVK